MGIFNFWKKREARSAMGAYYDGVEIAMGPEVYAAPLTIPVVLATIKMLSEDVARLPLKIYKKNKQGGRDEVSDHPLAELLQLIPNKYMSAYDMRKAVQANLAGWGNGYAYFRRRRDGKVLDIVPVAAEQVSILWRDDEYVYRLPNGELIPREEMLHLKGATRDGLTGMSLIRQMATTLHIAAQAEKYADELLKNMARPGAILQARAGERPVRAGSDEEKRLTEQWNSLHSGALRAGRTAIIPPAYEYKELTMPREDIQMIETRKFQKRDWAMVMRIPLHMLADLEKSSFNNISEQSVEYVKYAIAPHLQSWEQELNAKLLTAQERAKGYYIEHNLEGILRGDVKSRAEYYTMLHDRGIMNADEIRRRENMNPMPDGQGETYYIGSNYVPRGYISKDTAEQKGEGE